jgi:hypothetical protein
MSRRAVNDQASSSGATMMDASGARIKIKRGKRHPVEGRYRHRLTGCAPISN